MQRRRRRRTPAGGHSRLESAHRALLAETPSRAHPFLKSAHRAGLVAFDGGGDNDASDRLAVGVYVASVLVALAAEGELTDADAMVAVQTLAEARGEPVEAARFDLHRTASSSPLLIELPPLVACEIQLRLLMWLGIASEASLWRADDGNLEPVLSLGELAESRRARATGQRCAAARELVAPAGRAHAPLRPRPALQRPVRGRRRPGVGARLPG